MITIVYKKYTLIFILLSIKNIYKNIRKVPKLHIHTKQNNLDLRVKCNLVLG